MIRVQCPICERWTEGLTVAQLPTYPFCGKRCQRIDLGNWLGETYRVPMTERSHADSADPASEFADD
jgi:hypothetical protein